MTIQRSDEMSREEAANILQHEIGTIDQRREAVLVAITTLRREEKYRAFLESFVAWATGPDPINGNFHFVHGLSDKAEKALSENPAT